MCLLLLNFGFPLNFLYLQACSTQLVVQTATSNFRLPVHQLDNTRQNPVTFPIVSAESGPDAHRLRMGYTFLQLSFSRYQSPAELRQVISKTTGLGVQ